MQIPNRFAQVQRHWAIILFVPLLLPLAAAGQDSLQQTMRRCDSLLFEVGYNNCDIPQLEALISDRFEFYHDKSGITSSKAEFVKSIREGLCTSPYHPSRKLVPGSLKVYPLHNNDILYGAITTGKHRFYENPPGEGPQFRSVAKFTLLWLLEDGHWRLKQGLSFDHQTREATKDGGPGRLE